jgi:molybdopterin synthase catalytic subunit
MAEHALPRPQRAGDVPVKLFEITPDPISADDVIARLADPAVGAVATFVGVVRGETDGRQTLHLEYEAYPAMAEAGLAQIGDEVQERWPSIRQVAIVHRVGRLEIGEIVTVIAVSAAHRPEIFDALRFCIDRLKKIVPIWKKEVWADGEEWKSETSPQIARSNGTRTNTEEH